MAGRVCVQGAPTAAAAAELRDGVFLFLSDARGVVEIARTFQLRRSAALHNARFPWKMGRERTDDDAVLRNLAGVHTICLSSCTRSSDEGVKVKALAACIDQPGCTRITDECVKALAGVHTINLEGCSITDSCCGCRPKLLAAAPASQMRGAPSSGAPHLGVVCAPRRTAFARNSAAAQSTDQPDHYHEQTIVGSAHTMLSTPASTARTDGTSARTPIGTRTCAHIRPSTTTQPALWPAGQAYPATPPPHPSRLMRVGVVR
eukprot:CAMPEP_0177672298 /NCGR_PEP_ID=MMETSP0447-20121125/25246_1 /TAXON_ID=0 /ORGANISM="Stygamoeba regulata, Strain BSH-02190019" /LENGTH=260 /DNA_ID=CAMNT_0019179915 /DNA_START=121 /DNA_END=906 /DNA_ORIENTATION=-